MRRNTPALLWEIQTASGRILQVTNAVTVEQLLNDWMLRSIVERQFEIVGEAARRLVDYDPEIAAPLPGLRRAIGMRNVIAHQYDRIDWEEVRNVIDGPLVELNSAVTVLLAEITPPKE